MKPPRHTPQLLLLIPLLTWGHLPHSTAGLAQPPEIIGVSQIGADITAYLRPSGTEAVFPLHCGESATIHGWRFTEVQRAENHEVLRIRLEAGHHSVWLPVAGASATAAATAAPAPQPPAQPLPGLDIPASQHGPLHDQLLHRSRLRHKPSTRSPRTTPSELDPLPTKLARPPH